jgi:acetyl-CoA carboxylase, biotin carboxylase subunit
MFARILIDSHCELALRVVRTCRELGIETVTRYDHTERDNLHLRLSTECQLIQPHEVGDPDHLLGTALEKGAQAIYPGQRLLRGQSRLQLLCQQHGLTLIGPSAPVSDNMHKLDLLRKARAAGFPVVEHGEMLYDRGWEESPEMFHQLDRAAIQLGYPLLIKAVAVNSSLTQKLVRHASQLVPALQWVQCRAHITADDDRIYLERALPSPRRVAVQVAADAAGAISCLGEYSSLCSPLYGCLIEESPGPFLNEEQRQTVSQMAAEIAQLVGFQNIGSVEFLLDENGSFYLHDLTFNLHAGHPVIEHAAGIDLIRAQIALSAGEPLAQQNMGLPAGGAAMSASLQVDVRQTAFLDRICLEHVRLPSGPHVRIDTPLFSGCIETTGRPPALAQVSVWGETRAACLRRLSLALEECRVPDGSANLHLLRAAVTSSQFVQGDYAWLSCEAAGDILPDCGSQRARDLAVAASVLYALQEQFHRPAPALRYLSGWHHTVRTPPQWEVGRIVYGQVRS